MAILLAWVDFASRGIDPQQWRALTRAIVDHAPGVAMEVLRPGFAGFALQIRPHDPAPLTFRESELILRDGWASDPAMNQLAEIRIDARQVRLRRDRMGQRPLCFARIAGGVLVASSERWLLNHPSLSDDLDHHHLAAYFAALAPPEGSSAYRQISLVDAGETVSIDAHGERREQAPIAPLEVRGWTDERWTEEIDARLNAAVDSSLRDALQPGLSLSGGLDSSAVLAHANRPLQCFTYGSPSSPGFDEREIAARLALSRGHTATAIDADAFAPLGGAPRPQNIDHPASTPYRELKTAVYSAAQQRSVDVLLTGNFSDHLTAPRHYWFIDLVQQRQWRMLGTQLLRQWRAGPGSLWFDSGWRFALRGQRTPSPPTWLLPRWHEPATAPSVKVIDRYRDWPRPAQVAHALGTHCSADATESWFAQRFGIDVREPFRDWNLVQLLLSAPAHLSWRADVAKWGLRQSLANRLPAEWRLRSKSADQSPYYLRSLRNVQARVEQLISLGKPLWVDFVDSAAVDVALAKATGDDEHALLLWLLIGLGLWIEERQNMNSSANH